MRFCGQNHVSVGVRFCCLACFGMLAPASEVRSPSSSDGIEVASVRLDLDEISGHMPFIFRLGLQMGGHTGDAGQVLATEHRLGHFRISVGWSLREASSRLDALNRIRNSGYGQTASAVLAYGGEVTIGITHMPQYLSDCAHQTQPLPEDAGWYGFNRCPPSDYEGWADLVEAIVHYFTVELGLSVQYEVWNEPDIFFWAGTPDDYYRTYEWAVIGAHRADPAARLGGPSTSDFFSGVSDLPVTDGWIADFIAFCSSRSIPIDFLSWHRFGMTAHWGEYPIDTARRLLAEAGYPVDTRLLIDEWNIGVEYATEHSDTEYNAAFAVSRVIAWADMGLDRHCFATFGDWHPDPPEFHGGQGLVTASGIKKPVYNAFRLMGMLDGSQVPVTVHAPNPFVYSAASHRSASFVLIVANAVPDLSHALYVAIMDAVFAQDEGGLRSVVGEINAVVTSAIWEALIIDQTLEANDVTLSPLAGAALENAVAMGRDVVYWGESSLPLWIDVRNVPPDRVETHYLVDAMHANSYRAYENAVSAGLSEMEALATARRYQDLKPIASGIPGDRATRAFRLRPNSVLAIVWHPKDVPPLN